MMIFEGEYLNGMKNGKGKEYEGKLIFEGEYLNGMRNGQGKRIQKIWLFRIWRKILIWNEKL